jgi:hypothetical protein
LIGIEININKQLDKGKEIHIKSEKGREVDDGEVLLCFVSNSIRVFLSMRGMARVNLQ